MWKVWMVGWRTERGGCSTIWKRWGEKERDKWKRCADLDADRAEELMAERDTLRAQLEAEKRDVEVLVNNWAKYAPEIAALRARCEQLQRENEALVHGAELTGR